MGKEFVIPQSPESESIVLGSILIDGTNAMKKVAHILKHTDFNDDTNRYVFRAMEKLYSDQKDIDIVTVNDLLQSKGYLTMAGGASYLMTLSNSVTTSLHIVTHAKIVADRAVLRNIIRAATDITKMTQGEDDLDTLLVKAEERLKGVTRSASSAEDRLATVDLDEWRQIAKEAEDRNGKLRGISTGFKGIDDMIEGFEPGEMLILTGHTKHGKSRLAANIAFNVANAGKTVLYVNTEMTKLQMGRRFNAMIGDREIKGKIILNDKAGLNSNDVLHMMERAKENGCDMVIVDHLHFFSRSVDNQTNEISKIAKEFKDAAVEYDLPLLMLCHVQQADTKKKPTLQMIKNSSSIAQDADIVLAVWMDDRPNGDSSYTEVLRLAHRSAGNSKRYATLYNDGMKLTEQQPTPFDGPTYNPNQTTEGARIDDGDTDLKSWDKSPSKS